MVTTSDPLDAFGQDMLLYVVAEGEPNTLLERGGPRAEVGQEIGVLSPPEAVHFFAGERGTVVALRTAELASPRMFEVM